MMEPDSALREQLVNQYKLSCEICGSYPELKYCQQFSKGNLILDLSIINRVTLEILCHAITQSVTPVIIEVVLTTLKPRSEDEKIALNKIFKSLSITVRSSKTLSILKFMGIFIPENLLALLCQGLNKAKSLQVLEFLDCPMKNSCIEEICLSIKNTMCITSLAFKNCQIDNETLRSIKQLLMHQGLNRTSTLWKDTLRSQCPILDKMNGLRHLILNDNPLIGDEGLKELALVLSDDIWIIGIELQNCGITSKSVDAVTKLLEVNQVLESFSLDKNPFMDSDFITQLEDSLKKRIISYTNIESKVKGDETGPGEPPKEGAEEGIKDKVLPPRLKNLKPGVPWRIEGRLIERKEGLPVGTLSFIVEEISKTKHSRLEAKPRNREEKYEQIINLQNIRRVIHRYKSKLKVETKQKMKAEKRIKKLESKLEHYDNIFESNYVMDETTVSHIEECFSRFNIFLDKLRQARQHENQQTGDNKSEDSHKFYSDELINQTLPNFSSLRSKSRNSSSSSSKTIKSKSSSVHFASRGSQTDKVIFTIKSKDQPNADLKKIRVSKKSSLINANSEPLSISQLNSSKSTSENKTSTDSFQEVNKILQNDLEQRYKFENNLSSKSSELNGNINEFNQQISVKNTNKHHKVVGEEENNWELSKGDKNRNKLIENLDKNLKPEKNSVNSSSSLHHENRQRIENQFVGKNYDNYKANSSGSLSKFLPQNVEKKNVLYAENEFPMDEQSQLNNDNATEFNGNDLQDSNVYSSIENSQGTSEAHSCSQSQISNQEFSEPLNMKNIQFVSFLPTDGNAEISLSEGSEYMNVATHDKNVNFVKSLENVNETKILSYNPNSVGTNIETNNDSIQNVKQISPFNESYGSSNEKSESQIISIRNSRCPSINSISEQLSLGHERWTKKELKSSQGSIERSELYPKDFEDSEIEGISITESSVTPSNQT